MPTLQVLYGAEHGGTAGLTTGLAGNRIFDSTGGTPGTDIQVLAAAAKNGGYGLRITGANHYARWDTNTIGTPRSVMVMGFWFRITTDASGEKEVIAWDFNSGGSDFASIDYLPATGKLRAYVGGTTVDSTTTIAVGTWYWIDLRYTITTTTHSFSWAILGSTQPGVAAATGQVADTFTGVAIGDMSSGSTAVFDYDDILISVTSADYPLGSHKVVQLAIDPVATNTLTGTSGNFRLFSGLTPSLASWFAPTSRDWVAETPPRVGSAQDGWAQTTAAAGDYIAMPLTSYTLQAGESVSGARLLAAIWAASGVVGNLEFRSFNGTTERSIFAGTTGADNSATPAWACRMLTTLADYDTQAELDALTLRGGFSTNVATGIGLHAVYVELAVKEGTVTVVRPAVAAFTAIPRVLPKLLPVRVEAVTAVPGVTRVASLARVAVVVAIPAVRPATLPSNTEEFWSIDGVSLHQYGWSVTTVGGSRYDVPTRRGENMTLAYRPGTFHKAKMVNARTISLIMWMTGSIPATGAAVANPTVQWNDSWDFLRRLVFRPDGGRVTLTRRWMLNAAAPALLIAEAEAELVDTMNPKMTGRTRAEFVLDLLLADPYFYGPLVTVNVNQGTPVSVTNPGHDTAGHNNMEVDFVGPLTNPRLTNTTPHPDVWVQYSGVIAAGQILRLSIPSFTALRVADAENLVGGISHSGARLWMALPAGANQLTLTATAGAGTAQLRYQPPYI